MTTLYSKDSSTGIVAIAAETVIDKNALHDSFGRFFVPGGKPFRVLFECMGQTQVAASGVAAAKVGRVCPIRVKVRIEPESDLPTDPAAESEI